MYCSIPAIWRRGSANPRWRAGVGSGSFRELCESTVFHSPLYLSLSFQSICLTSTRIHRFLTGDCKLEARSTRGGWVRTKVSHRFCI
uniref:Uncharacterized protein n=1 Tax=Setaria italica TaxID=4555 RepID=K3XPZ9_SETIT